MVDFTTISPHLSVKISPKAKRLALRLDSRTRKVNLVIPKRASLQKAYEFAESYQDWINDKIDGLPCPVPYKDGVVIPIMGRSIKLKIIKGNSKVTQFELTDKELIVTTQLDDATPRIGRYLRNLAHEELEKLANQKAALLHRKLSKFVVRDMKSRWGSCSIDGRMTLSWRLIFAPMESIDYVISHEAAHLIHPDHSQNFWALCEKISDDFIVGHSWMQKMGSSLGRYGENTQ
jgi:predicted metal-dependent hydrolase